MERYKPYLLLLKRGWQGPTPSCPTIQVLHRRVLDAFDTFRILCAHRQGRDGVSGINDTVIALLRRAGLVKPTHRWWAGRPLMVLRNDYNVRLSGGGRGLFNGDVGILVHGEGSGDRVLAAFPGPDGLPSVADPQDPPPLEPQDYQGRHLVDYVQPHALPEHDTVFAMTIHKSQGSEFQRVLLVLPLNESPILTRELIYTGITRARRNVTVLCDPDLLRNALSVTVKRASGLSTQLWAP